MLQFHKTELAGCLFEDPSVRHNPEQNSYTVRFRIGVTESWKDRQTGDWKDRTESYLAVKYDCTEAFVQFIEQNIRTGTNVYLTGSNATRKYRPQGATADQYITEIRISDIQKIQDPKPKDQQSYDQGYQQKPQQQDNIPHASAPAPQQRPKANPHAAPAHAQQQRPSANPHVQQKNPPHSEVNAFDEFMQGEDPFADMRTS